MADTDPPDVKKLRLPSKEFKDTVREGYVEIPFFWTVYRPYLTEQEVTNLLKHTEFEWVGIDDISDHGLTNSIIDRGKRPITITHNYIYDPSTDKYNFMYRIYEARYVNRNEIRDLWIKNTLSSLDENQLLPFDWESYTLGKKWHLGLFIRHYLDGGHYTSEEIHEYYMYSEDYEYRMWLLWKYWNVMRGLKYPTFENFRRYISMLKKLNLLTYSAKRRIPSLEPNACPRLYLTIQKDITKIPFFKFEQSRLSMPNSTIVCGQEIPLVMLYKGWCNPKLMLNKLGELERSVMSSTEPSQRPPTELYDNFVNEVFQFTSRWLDSIERILPDYHNKWNSKYKAIIDAELERRENEERILLSRQPDVERVCNLLSIPEIEMLGKRRDIKPEKKEKQKRHKIKQLFRHEQAIDDREALQIMTGCDWGFEWIHLGPPQQRTSDDVNRDLKRLKDYLILTKEQICNKDEIDNGYHRSLLPIVITHSVNPDDGNVYYYIYYKPRYPQHAELRDSLLEFHHIKLIDREFSLRELNDIKDRNDRIELGIIGPESKNNILDEDYVKMLIEENLIPFAVTEKWITEGEVEPPIYYVWEAVVSAEKRIMGNYITTEDLIDKRLPYWTPYDENTIPFKTFDNERLLNEYLEKDFEREIERVYIDGVEYNCSLDLIEYDDIELLADPNYIYDRIINNNILVCVITYNLKKDAYELWIPDVDSLIMYLNFFRK